MPFTFPYIGGISTSIGFLKGNERISERIRNISALEGYTLPAAKIELHVKGGLLSKNMHVDRTLQEIIS